MPGTVRIQLITVTICNKMTPNYHPPLNFGKSRQLDLHKQYTIAHKICMFIPWKCTHTFFNMYRMGSNHWTIITLIILTWYEGTHTDLGYFSHKGPFIRPFVIISPCLDGKVRNYEVSQNNITMRSHWYLLHTTVACWYQFFHSHGDICLWTPEAKCHCSKHVILD